MRVIMRERKNRKLLKETLCALELMRGEAFIARTKHEEVRSAIKEKQINRIYKLQDYADHRIKLYKEQYNEMLRSDKASKDDLLNECNQKIQGAVEFRDKAISIVSSKCVEKLRRLQKRFDKDYKKLSMACIGLNEQANSLLKADCGE